MNTLDDNETALANAKAKAALLAKLRQMRREAMQRGDQGSPVEPVSFAPLTCTGCDVLLTRQNHGNAQQCQRCFEEAQALRNFEAARLRLIAENNAALAKKARSAFLSALWLIIPLVLLLFVGVAAVKGWVQ